MAVQKAVFSVGKKVDKLAGESVELSVDTLVESRAVLKASLKAALSEESWVD